MTEAQEIKERQQRILDFLKDELGSDFVAHIIFDPKENGNAKHIYLPSQPLTGMPFWKVKILVSCTFSAVMGWFNSVWGQAEAKAQPPQSRDVG